MCNSLRPNGHLSFVPLSDIKLSFVQHDATYILYSVTATLGNLEGGSFTRDLYVEEGSGDGHLPP